MPRVVNRQRIYRGVFASELGRRVGIPSDVAAAALDGSG